MAKSTKTTAPTATASDSYAIFQTGGKQYQAIKNNTIGIEKLSAQEGEEVTFTEVLLRKVGESIEVGRPFLSAPITAVVVKHLKGPKVKVFKFKRRKKYKRLQGHRQPVTVVRIVNI